MMKSKATKVQELTIKFRNVQRDFLNDLKRQERSNNQFYDEENVTSGAGGLSQWDMICNNNMTQEQLDMLQNHVHITNIRRQEILSVAKSVNQLAELYNELSILVVEQGSVLDRIDYNVEETVKSLQASKDVIKDAEKYQKASRSAYCIVLLIILIAICAFILIVRSSTR